MMIELRIFIIVVNTVVAMNTTLAPLTFFRHNNQFTDQYLNKIFNENNELSINYRHSEILESRIIDGFPADIRYFPFVACLVTKSYATNFRGGASIISPYWAVTAAHCLQEIGRYRLQANMAFVRSNSSYWRHYYMEHLIIKAVIHMNYTRHINNALDYDIGLVKVATPFQGNYERQIAFANANFRPEVDREAIVLGWGTTDPLGTDVNEKLRYTLIRVNNQKNCKALFKHRKNTQITNRMLCAGAPGRDSCINDSGGPLLQNQILFGIVSFGVKGCANPVYPGIYSRVQYFNDWIRHHIAHEYEERKSDNSKQKGRN
ncbi:hypothetical protein ILUMI_04366 [Ignelater luminosus]|uniref:Peptidase S1 domain-containing protein n=1 Tax=Ignelater luminosus TaxID=2038154 RepID=A0A8K0DEW8_IGNLU|nr:hypothetical protein ILUMI_04366 [Ignelater luminosus]